jgi:UDP-glucuronate decarboxylase
MKKINLDKNRYESNSLLLEDLFDSIDFNFDLKSIKNKSFLIFGGSGFLGSQICKALLLLNDKYNLKIKITCVYRSEINLKKGLKKWLQHPNLLIENYDISDKKSFKQLDYNFIIHSASIANPIAYKNNEEKIIKSNIDGTINILNNLNSDIVEKYMYISSGEIYGNLNISNIEESSFGAINPRNSRSIYPLSKKLSETYTILKSELNNLNFNIVRPFHIYGPGMNLNDGKIHSVLINSIISKKNIELFSNGQSIRTFCYISDAVRAFLTVLFQAKSGEIYNIANTEEPIKIIDLCENIINSQKENLNIIINNDTTYEQSPILANIPSCEKLISLGWKPNVDLNSGFDRSINFFRQ